MKADTPYHMRAKVSLSDGTQFADADQTFTTGKPVKTLPVLTATNNAGNDAANLVGGAGC